MQRIAIVLGNALNSDGSLSTIGTARVAMIHQLISKMKINTIILSGGNPIYNKSEAEVMCSCIPEATKSLLGMNDIKVLLEEQSTNTKENAKYCSAKIAQLGSVPSEVIVCTTEEHLFRFHDNPIVLFRKELDINKLSGVRIKAFDENLNKAAVLNEQPDNSYVYTEEEVVFSEKRLEQFFSKDFTHASFFSKLKKDFLLNSFCGNEADKLSKVINQLSKVSDKNSNLKNQLKPFSLFMSSLYSDNNFYFRENELIDLFRFFLSDKDIFIDDLMSNGIKSKYITSLKSLHLLYFTENRRSSFINTMANDSERYADLSCSEQLTCVESFLSDNFIADNLIADDIDKLFYMIRETKKIGTSSILSFYEVVLYILLTYARRKKSLLEFVKICSRFDSEKLFHESHILKSYSLYSTLQKIIKDKDKDTVIDTDTNKSDFLEILCDKYKEDDIERITKGKSESLISAGTLSTYADLFATYLDGQDILSDLFNKCVKNARQSIKAAIEYNSYYPKYYAIAAKIDLLDYERSNDNKNVSGNESKYINIISNLTKACNRQATGEKLADYKRLLAKAEITKLSKDISRQQKEFEDIKKSNIKIISLFISIASFLLGIITKATSSNTFSFNEMASIFVLMLGIAVSIYAVMDLFVIDNIFPSKTMNRISLVIGKIILVVIGLALIAVGFVLGNILTNS